MNLTKKKLPKWLWGGAGVAALLFAAAILVLYVTGTTLATLHSDSTDSLLWANATAQSGRVLDHKFTYAAILPFGGSLWMVPLLKIFGYGRTSYVLSMLIFVVLFMGAAYYMLRSLKFSRVWSAIGTAVICLILSGSPTMLEMMWGHVIYYSLSILFYMLAVSLTLRLTDVVLAWKRGDKIGWRKLILLGLLAILCAGSATDGIQIIVMSTVPVMGGLIAMAFFDEKPLLGKSNLRMYALCAFMAVATVAGLVLLTLFTRNGRIDAVYANAYDYWSPAEKWTENLLQLFPSLYSVFGVRVQDGTKLFEPESVAYVLKLFYLVLIIGCPVVMLFRYKKLRQSTKLMVWAHLILSVVLFLGFVCGKLYTGQWRLIPFIGTGTILLMAGLRELWGGKQVAKRLCCVIAAMMAVICLYNAIKVAQMPHGVENNVRWALTQELKERGYTHGYATFWNSLPVNILSDDEIHLGTLEQTAEGDLIPRNYQNYKNEFDACPEGTACFLVLDSYEFSEVQKSEYWARLKEQRNLIDSFTCGDYIVLVFDGHVIV